jgi:hypothetical protein
MGPPAEVGIDTERSYFYTFNEKNTSRPKPRLFKRSKVLAVGGVTCVHMSMRNCPGTGEGWWGGEELPLLIEN